MTQVHATATFHDEYEADLRNWLRRRYVVYALVAVFMLLLVAGAGLGTGVSLIYGVAPDYAQTASDSHGGDSVREQPSSWFLLAVLMTIFALVYGISAVWVHRRRPSQHDIILLVFWQYFALQVATVVFVAALTLWHRTGPWLFWVALAVVFLGHLLVCLLIPWRVRDAIVALAPLLVVLGIVVFLLVDAQWWLRVAAVLVLPWLGVPGVLISAWRRRTFEFQKVATHFSELRQELSVARRIHEDSFPAPITTGPLRFHYAYEPMEELGGDFLYLHADPTSGDAPAPLLLIVMDVTGHGVSATLAVNRLYGEIQRLIATAVGHPLPDALVSGLNAYIAHTFRGYNVFATMTCLRIDRGAGKIEWVNAGSPPMFLIRQDGRLDHLESNTMVLGAVSASEFETETSEADWQPGDTLFIFTDGATDTPDAQEQMLGIQGLERMVVEAWRGRPEDLTAEVMRRLNEYRDGPRQDDTLLVEIRKSLDADDRADET